MQASSDFPQTASDVVSCQCNPFPEWTPQHQMVFLPSFGGTSLVPFCLLVMISLDAEQCDGLNQEELRTWCLGCTVKLGALMKHTMAVHLLCFNAWMALMFAGTSVCCGFGDPCLLLLHAPQSCPCSSLFQKCCQTEGTGYRPSKGQMG